MEGGTGPHHPQRLSCGSSNAGILHWALSEVPTQLECPPRTFRLIPYLPAERLSSQPSPSREGVRGGTGFACRGPVWLQHPHSNQTFQKAPHLRKGNDKCAFRWWEGWGFGEMNSRRHSGLLGALSIQ